jgi:hypothetical protein
MDDKNTNHLKLGSTYHWSSIIHIRNNHAYFYIEEMITMEKIYDLINRGNGASTRCSEKNLIDWVNRGYEVESFTYDESLKEGPIQASPVMNSKTAKGLHLSSNNIEYFSTLNRPIKKM